MDKELAGVIFRMLESSSYTFTIEAFTDVVLMSVRGRQKFLRNDARLELHEFFGLLDLAEQFDQLGKKYLTNNASHSEVAKPLEPIADETPNEFIHAELVEVPPEDQVIPTSPDPISNLPQPEMVPLHEIEVVPTEGDEEPFESWLHHSASRAKSIEKLPGADNQREMLTSHRTAGKKSYSLLDFFLVLSGLVIWIAIGSLAAGMEYFLSGWLTDYRWIAGFSAGLVSAIGGIVASAFFINVLSKYLFNRDSDRWKREMEYPRTWQALLILVFSFLSLEALFVIAILGAVGGGIGIFASAALTAPATGIAIGVAPPIIAGGLALFLIYEMAAGRATL
jgi:hypothetical protein